MTAAELAQIELAALEALAWGEGEPIIDACEDGTLDPARFANPGHRAIASAACALVAAGEVPENVPIHRQMMADGWPCWDAATVLAVDGGLDALRSVLPNADGHRYNSLGHLLHLLAEEDERKRLTERLVSLANALRFPGGPARVAEALGVAS